MIPIKSSPEAVVSENASPPPYADGAGGAMEEFKSTAADARDMARMGHQQQLVRRFSMWKSIAFVCVAMVSWELSIFTINAALVGGGRAGLVWSMIWCLACFTPVFLSMAEMASMAPIAGSQYHWVSEFCPEKWQRGMSYFTGWMSVLAWQAGNAQGFLLTGQLIQAMAEIAYPDTYTPQPYHATLLTIAICFLTFSTNYYLHKWLPQVQYIIFVGHVTLFLIFVISVSVLAPKATSAQVWTDFQGTGGYSSLALGVFAGQVSAISASTGADTVGHLAEEIEDASYSVPRAMLAAYGVNALLSIPIAIVICYAMPDLDAALKDVTTYPAVYVLRQTMSDGCLLAFLALTTFVLFCGNVNYMVAVSRDLWAFARDNGTPFPRLLSGVSSKKHIPTAAIAASCIFSGLISILYIGSSVAYYAVVSLLIVAILQCYMFTIGCLLWRRIFYPSTLPPSRFSLGRRTGIVLNVFAIIWVIWSFFWAFWPQYSPVTAENMNWASVIFGGTLFFSGLFYLFRARKVYKGPVTGVAGRHGNAGLLETESDGVREGGSTDEKSPS